eukprot:s2671_g2.t1
MITSVLPAHPLSQHPWPQDDNVRATSELPEHMQAEFSDVRWGCAPTRARLDALGQKLLQACCGCSDDDVHHPASADALAQRPHSDDADRIKSRILHGKVQLQDKDAWKTLSSPARQFVKSLLSVEPSKRPTARSALNHEWLRHRSASRRLTKMTSMAQSFMAQLRDPGVPGTFARACIMLLMWLICHCGEDEAGTAESPAARGDLPGAQSEGVHSFAFVRKGLFMSALKDPDRAPRACQQIFSLLRGSGPWAQIFEAMRPFEAEMTGQLLTQAFGILDHDGKGFVTLPNMQDVFGDGGWDVAEMLREVTGSGDEAITYSQFRKHMCVEDDEVVV